MISIQVEFVPISEQPFDPSLIKELAYLCLCTGLEIKAHPDCPFGENLSISASETHEISKDELRSLRREEDTHIVEEALPDINLSDSSIPILMIDTAGSFIKILAVCALSLATEAERVECNAAQIAQTCYNIFGIAAIRFISQSKTIEEISPDDIEIPQDKLVEQIEEILELL